MKPLIGNSRLKQVFDTKAFKAILKKCPNIRCIGINNNEMDFNQNNKIIEIIVKYCHELTEIYLDFELITTNNFNCFIDKFGQTIRKCDYYPNYYIEFKHNTNLLDNCTFIEQLNLLGSYPNYDLLNSHYFKLERLPRLKCLVFWLYLDPEVKLISKLIDYNSNTLEVIHIWVYNTDQNKYKVIFEELTKLVQLKSFKIDFNIKDSNNYWSGYDYDSNYMYQMPEIFPDLLMSISKFCPNINDIEIITYAKEILCQNVYETIQQFPRLKRLKLHFKYVDEKIKYQYKSEFLRNCKQLTHLSLEIPLIDNEFFTNISTNLPKLQYLSLNTVKHNYVNIFVKRLSNINCLKNIIFYLDYWDEYIESKLSEVIFSIDYSNRFRKLNNLIINNKSQIVFDIRNYNLTEFIDQK